VSFVTLNYQFQVVDLKTLTLSMVVGDERLCQQVGLTTSTQAVQPVV
jgi:hypothetical protein